MRTEETILLCVSVCAQSVEKSSFHCFDLFDYGLKCVRIQAVVGFLACVLVLLFPHKESPFYVASTTWYTVEDVVVKTYYILLKLTKKVIVSDNFQILILYRCK